MKTFSLQVCEVKRKNAKDCTLKDIEITNYSLHQVNLENNSGRGIAVYFHCSIEKSSIKIGPNLSFEEVCQLEVRLRGGDMLLFGCCFRRPTTTETSADGSSICFEVKSIEAVRGGCFHQHVEQPTGRRGNDDPSRLYLSFTDEAMQVTELSHLPL